MRSSLLGGALTRPRAARALAASHRFWQQKVDDAAVEVARYPDLLRMPRTVLAGDIAEKYGLSRANAYRVILAAERELRR